MENITTKHSNKNDYIFYLSVFIAFYALNRYSFLTADDYWYSFRCSNDNYFMISSLKDAFSNQLDAYMNWNGRLIVHTLTSYFCGVAGMNIFQICNSIIFTLMCYGLNKLIHYEHNHTNIDKYITLFLVFIFMPWPGQIFLGSIAMCINYLWTSCAIIYFLILYHNLQKQNNSSKFINNICIFFISLLIGSLQESFSIGISGALFFYYLLNLEKFKSKIRWLLIGFWTGTIIVTFAPGNFIRLASLESNNIFTGVIGYIKNLLFAIAESQLFLIFLICVTLFSLYYKHPVIKYLKRHSILLTTIAFNFLIMMITNSGIRQLTCIELLSMILLINLVYEFGHDFIIKFAKSIKVSITVILLISYIPIYACRQFSYSAYQELYHSEVINHNIINTSYIKSKRLIQKKLYSKYTYQPDFENWVYTGFSLLKSEGTDINFVKAILPNKPDSIINLYNLYNKNGIYHNTKEDYYIIKRTLQDPILKCEVLTEPKSTFGKWRNKLLGQSNIYKIDITTELRDFKQGNAIYYIFYKPDYKVLKIITE